MREPLIAPLAAIAAGILCSRFVSFEVRELLAVISALLLLTLIAFWRRIRRAALLSGWFALLFAGSLLAVLHRPGPQPELDAKPREIVIVSGCVVEPPVFSEGREQVILQLAPGARARISFYQSETEPLPRLVYGQKVDVEARVRRPRNFGNPGSFDSVGYLARQNIYWIGSVPARSTARVVGSCGTPFWHAIYGLRQKTLDRLERLFGGSRYDTAMMQAVLVGDSSKLKEAWTEHFRSTGTYHALVISGLHVTVLATIFFLFLRLCRVPEVYVLLLTTLASWLYALVTGWRTPTVRAVAGVSLFLLGRYFYRRRRLLNLLAAIAIAFLVADPEQLFEASFQLSFLSVGAISALALPLLERTSAGLIRGLSGLEDPDRDLHLPPRVAQFRVEVRLLSETLTMWTRIGQRQVCWVLGVVLRILFRVYELVVISAAVQVGLALPMAVYFHRISFSGLSANVVIVPMTSVLVPVGFLSVFTGWSLPARLASWLLAVTRAVVDWHASWEPNWRVPDPPVWLAISIAVALVALAVTVHASRRWHWAAAATVTSLLSVLLWHPFAPEIELGTLELTAIDVGQGDSLLLAFPEGKLVLVDGGGIPTYGRGEPGGLDIGEDVISPYLWSRSIRRLDAVVITHGHEDHMGGLSAVIENFRPKQLWTGAMSESEGWIRLRETARRCGVTVLPMRRGKHFTYSGSQVEVLSPDADYAPKEEADNNDSLVLRVSFGAHSFFLPGDIERKAESELVSEGLVTKTDVLKVAHHGSRTSSNGPFLDAARPAFAVVSAGYENAYNNPHPDLVDRVRRRHTALFRTDYWGLISIRTDGRRFRVDTMRGSPEPLRSYLAF